MGRDVLLDRLGGLLGYPQSAVDAEVRACAEALAAVDAEAAEHLSAFHRQVQGRSIEDLQELFVNAFDCNPGRALEVGWHLFGEDYKRGSFLVWMRSKLRDFGLPESSELPDHLTHVLAVLGRMETAEADEFAATCVLPVLERMIPGFAKDGNPYENILKSIRRVLNRLHGPGQVQSLPLVVIPAVQEATQADSWEACR